MLQIREICYTFNVIITFNGFQGACRSQSWFLLNKGVAEPDHGQEFLFCH